MCRLFNVTGACTLKAIQMDSAKIKIRQYTEAYRTVEPFRNEYQMFLSGRREAVRRNTDVHDNKFAEVKGGAGVTERLLTEVPETLYTILYKQLTPEEWMWFESVPGKTWYGSEYREFSATGGKL